MSQKTHRWVQFGALALVASGLVACSDIAGTDSPAGFKPQLAVTPPAPTQKEAQLCVSGPAGSYTFTISETDPSNILTLSAGTAVSLNADQCVLIGAAIKAAFATTADVNVTWNGSPNTVTLTNVSKTAYTFVNSTDTNPTSSTSTLSGPSASSTLGIERAGLLVFNFAAIPQDTTPQTPLKGCSPGYWKQSQHFDSYPAPYTPNTLFSSVFENAFPGMTLVEVLGQGGGGLKALGRHTVAALLSSGAGLNTGYTAQGVIDAFNGAFPASNYNSLLGTFEAVSNLGCPLN